MDVVRIEGKVMPYAWGSPAAISELLGRAPSVRPEAELWMGAHPQAPARVVEPGVPAADLQALIASDPDRYLGQAVVERFSELPFLFKILSADQPLSLQAHPTQEQARIGFAREEANGVPRDARERIYKDARHKPEIICALSEFWALSGFRTPEEMLSLGVHFGFRQGTDELSELFAAFDASGGRDLEPFFRGLFSLPPAARDRAIARARRSAQTSSGFSEVAQWLERLATLYPGDPGVLGALLLNVVRLNPGEAIYLPAGNLHAYLAGTGLELMASSDNVLRGGLTPKHVDVEELCHVLTFEAYQPEVLRPQEAGVGVARYVTPAAEFELCDVHFEEGVVVRAVGPEIWLVLEGAVQLCGPDGTQMDLGRGAQLFVGAASEIAARGRGRVARARVPGRKA